MMQYNLLIHSFPKKKKTLNSLSHLVAILHAFFGHRFMQGLWMESMRN